jgi:hypothetical protein
MRPRTRLSSARPVSADGAREIEAQTLFVSGEHGGGWKLRIGRRNDDELDGRVRHVSFPVDEGKADSIQNAAENVLHDDAVLLTEHRQTKKQQPACEAHIDTIILSFPGGNE